MLKILEFSPIFRGLTSQQIERELSNINYDIIKYKSKNLIKLRGDICDGLYILLEGVVTGEMINQEGKKVVVEELKAPYPLAIAFIFGSQNFYPVNIVAKEDVQLLFIHKEKLLKLFNRSEQILKNFLDVLSQKTQFLTQRFWSSSMKKGIKGRFCSYLLDNSKKGIFEMSGSIKSLAEYLGTQRPSLSRVISQLKDEGAIHELKKGTYKIIDARLLGKYIYD